MSPSGPASTNMGGWAKLQAWSKSMHLAVQGVGQHQSATFPFACTSLSSQQPAKPLAPPFGTQPFPIHCVCCGGGGVCVCVLCVCVPGRFEHAAAA